MDVVPLFGIQKTGTLIVQIQDAKKYMAACM